MKILRFLAGIFIPVISGLMVGFSYSLMMINKPIGIVGMIIGITIFAYFMFIDAIRQGQRERAEFKKFLADIENRFAKSSVELIDNCNNEDHDCNRCRAYHECNLSHKKIYD